MLGIFMLLGAGAFALGSSVSKAVVRNEAAAQTSKADQAQKLITSKTLNPHIENLVSDELLHIKTSNMRYTETLIKEVESELNYIFGDEWKTSEDKIAWDLEMSTFPVWVVIDHLLLAKKGVLKKRATAPLVFYEISTIEKMYYDTRFVQMVEKCINESTGLDITWVYKSYFNNTGTPTPYGGGFLIRECLPLCMLSDTSSRWVKGEYT